MTIPVEQQALHAQLERWRLRAERACAARRGDAATLEALDDELANVERLIAAPAGRHPRMAQLATRLAEPGGDRSCGRRSRSPPNPASSAPRRR